MKCRAFSVLTYFVSFLILVFLFSFFDASEAMAVVVQANVFFVVSAFLLAGFVLFLKAYRWHTLLLNSGYRVKVSYSCVSMFLGLFACVLTPGKVGEPIRAYFLKKMNRDRMSGTVPLVVIERVVDVVLLVLVSAAGPLVFMSWLEVAQLHLLEVFVLVVFVVLCIVFALLNKNVVFFVIGKVNGIFRQKIDPDLFCSAVERTKSGGFLWWLMLSTAVIWFFEGLVLYVSLLSVGLFLSPLICFVLVSISFLVGAVTFLPGGLGSLDAALIFLISLFGLDVNAVVAGVIVYRVLSYLMLAVLGVGSMPFLNRWSKAGRSG